RSGGLTRFLRHIAIETLEGRGERLKEYTLAVEVFGRPASYDPQVDSLVRVQASVLRSRLEQYYASAGHNETVVIEIPKGGYQANFVESRIPMDHAAASPTPSATIEDPTVAGGMVNGASGV